MNPEIEKLLKVIFSLYEAECFIHRTVNGDFYDCFDLPHYKEAEKVLVEYGMLDKRKCVSSVDTSWCTDGEDNESQSDSIP